MSIDKVNELQTKLQKFIEDECTWCDKKGTSKFSTCDHSTWDQDIFNHKDQIIEAIRKRGYKVTSSINWGVYDIVITKQLTLQ